MQAFLLWIRPIIACLKTISRGVLNELQFLAPGSAGTLSASLGLPETRANIGWRLLDSEIDFSRSLLVLVDRKRLIEVLCELLHGLSPAVNVEVEQIKSRGRTRKFQRSWIDLIVLEDIIYQHEPALCFDETFQFIVRDDLKDIEIRLSQLKLIRIQGTNLTPMFSRLRALKVPENDELLLPTVDTPRKRDDLSKGAQKFVINLGAEDSEEDSLF